MDYQHATANDMAVFLRGRLVAMEQEHYNYQILADAAETPEEKAQWEGPLKRTERAILAFREELAKVSS